MNHIGPVFLTVLGSIFGLAALAVIVSQRAQTPAVLKAGGNFFSQVIGAAVSPVTGTSPGVVGLNPPSFGGIGAGGSGGLSFGLGVAVPFGG